MNAPTFDPCPIQLILGNYCGKQSFKANVVLDSECSTWGYQSWSLQCKIWDGHLHDHHGPPYFSVPAEEQLFIVASLPKRS